MVRVCRDDPVNSSISVFLDGEDVSDICVRLDTDEGWVIVNGKRRFGKVEVVQRFATCGKCAPRPPTELKYLITGTGHSGTTWASIVLTTAGFKCGREVFFRRGGIEQALIKLKNTPGYQAESSWLAAPFLDHPVLDSTLKIHLVRHPLKVISSWVHSDKTNGCLSGSGNCPFANYYTDFMSNDTKLDRAVRRYLVWNGIIESSEIRRVRIEDGATALLAACEIDPQRVFEGVNVYSHNPYSFEVDLTKSKLYDDLEQMSERYGYEL